jgi:hypothetical protein
MQHAPSGSAAPSGAPVAAPDASASEIIDLVTPDDHVDACVGKGRSEQSTPGARTVDGVEAARRGGRSFQYPIRMAETMFTLERDQGVAMSDAQQPVPIERYWHASEHCFSSLLLATLCANSNRPFTLLHSLPLAQDSPQCVL